MCELADIDPLGSMEAEFFRCEPSTTRMLRIVRMNVSVTIEAHRDSIRDVVSAAIGNWQHVVGLDLRAAESMTNAAAALAFCQKGLNVGTIEYHGTL